MRTFDFFDTLVTRLVANPHDIFTLVGESIGVDNFKHIRVSAELSARRIHNGEVTFQQIYAQINLDDDLRKRAYEEELRLEKGLMSLIAENGKLFSSDDVVVSDMYHGVDFFSDVLSEILPEKPPKLILVSGERGFNKRDGGMWRFLREQHPDHSHHIGDNFEADVRQARKHGLSASHYDAAKLNPAEMALAATGLDGSLVAGASRATRLELVDSDTTIEQRAIIETFASVFGPLIFGFSTWVIDSCLFRDIDRIFFLARDGKIIHEACRELISNRNLAIETKYIYASREALHLPGFRDLKSAESWLLDGTSHLSLETIAERGRIPIEVVIDAARSKLDVSPIHNLSTEQRIALPGILRHSAIMRALETSSTTAFDIACEYYREQGIFRSPSFAVVDIGWNGRMQSSLRSLIDKTLAPVEHILGLYVCLARRAFPDSRDVLRGYLAEPPHGRDRPIFDYYRSVLEAAFSADHATTLGFERNGDRVTPRLGEPWSPRMQQRIELQHRVIRAFITNIVKIENVTKRRICPPTKVIRDNLRELLTSPTKNQALAFVDFEFAEGQGSDTLVPIARRMRLNRLLADRRSWGYWREGTLRASGFGSLMNARRYYHFFRYPSRVR